MIVSKKVSFDAAHYLPNYEGKCSNLHGHTWKVEAGIRGKMRSKSGMVVDFSWLKKVLEREVIEVFDHTSLNEILSNPTAENIAKYIYSEVTYNWMQGGREEGIRLEYVRVWESEDSMVEYSYEDWCEDEKN